MHHALRLIAVLITAVVATSLRGAEEPPRSPVDEEGRVVNFRRDIAPLLAAHCLECHGSENPKADFQVNDRDIFLQYIEPEDAESSMLYTDYLLSVDPDMLMPPPSHKGPLQPAELALIRLWIEEGAVWPEGVPVQGPTIHVEVEHSDAPAAPAEPPRAGPQPLLARVWAFQGYLHPATVHFPIALLMLGGLFVVLGLKWPALGTQIPLACLLLGSVSAVVACLMGWSFATEEGYPSYTAGMDKEVNWHRWSGIFVAALSVVLAVIAVVATVRNSRKLNGVWKTGLLVAAAAVGLVGHQGGELTYGKEFYIEAFETLWGEAEELGETIEENLEVKSPAAEGE